MWWFSFSLDRGSMESNILHLAYLQHSHANILCFARPNSTLASCGPRWWSSRAGWETHIRSSWLYIIQVYLKPTLDFDPSLKIKRSHKYWSVSQQTNVFSGHPHPTYRNSMTHSLRTTALNSLKVSSVLTVCGVGREETGNRARSERALGRLSPGLQSTLWTEHALWEKNKTSSAPEQDWKNKQTQSFLFYFISKRCRWPFTFRCDYIDKKQGPVLTFTPLCWLTVRPAHQTQITNFMSVLAQR